MADRELHVVTGAFGYSGKYIASRLLQAGHRVRTLTNSTGRANPFGGKVEVYPFSFSHPERLADSLKDASVLCNTYWVRFNHRDFKHSEAFANSVRLFEAARRAGVARIVHVSITNPSEESRLEYFRAKAKLERRLVESGLSYCILRPAVLFGREDILINNIAWALRRFPVFGIFGDGHYRLQPIYVDDLAQLAIELGKNRAADAIIDAIGPETFTYVELVRAISNAIGVRRPFISIPPRLGLAIGRVIGTIRRDVMITKEEIEGLMSGLLCTKSAPAGQTRLTDWLRQNAAALGRKYASELGRRRNRHEPYERL